MSAIDFTLDGRPTSYTGDPQRKLLDFLRDDLGITSPKDGCSGQGFCRACTVEIDGRAKLACITAMKTLAGKSVTTLEGLPDDVRGLLAEAFVRHGAVQCGFCTPGYLARTRILLQENPAPTREEVVAALRLHVCRCTGYHAVVDAVLTAAAMLRGEATTAPGGGGVGTSQPKFRAHQKALGTDPFVDDLRLDGMLHGAIRFSDHPRAVVRALDTEAAAAMPGVVRVITAADVPGQRHQGLIVKDWPLLVAAGEATRYVGDALALVVAATEAEARAATAAITVTYEVLEPLTDPVAALASDVHLHPGGNLLEKSLVRRGGDVEAALARSAYTAGGTYTTQRIEHAFLEPEATVARPWRDGGVEVFSPGQGVYVDRVQIASLLGAPLEQVKVDQVACGGAFGGKEDLSVQGHAALAAHLLQRPVKVKLSRPESIRMHPKRHPLTMEFAVGCDADGKLTALRARIIGDTGAYASVGGKVLERAAGHATGAYHVPCVDLEARAVYTNNLPCGAMRGFGVNQVTFALESCLDDLCRQGGFDRWQFRWDNALTAGGLTATGQVMDEGVGVRETLLAVKDAYLPAEHCGLACGIKNCGIGNGMADWCEVEIEVVAADRVIVRHGWTEMGQGVHTVAQQVLSEATGIDPAMVEAVVSHGRRRRGGHDHLEPRHIPGGQRHHRGRARPAARPRRRRPRRPGGPTLPRPLELRPVDGARRARRGRHPLLLQLRHPAGDPRPRGRHRPRRRRPRRRPHPQHHPVPRADPGVGAHGPGLRAERGTAADGRRTAVLALQGPRPHPHGRDPAHRGDRRRGARPPRPLRRQGRGRGRPGAHGRGGGLRLCGLRRPAALLLALAAPGARLMNLYLRDVVFWDRRTGALSPGNLLVEPGTGGAMRLVDRPPAAGDTVIDGHGNLALEGLTCGHHHIYSALARGMPAPPRAPRNFAEILELVWWRLDRCLDLEMIRASALAAAMDCLRCGVTRIVDHHASPGAVGGSLGAIADAFDEVGLSHVLCYELSDRDGPQVAAEGLAETDRHLASGRPGLVGLHASFTVGDALLGQAVDLAARHGVGLHLHVAEDQVDQERCLADHGCRVVERLHGAGVLDQPGTILAHCLHLTDPERRLVGDSPAWVVQNTESNQNNAVGEFRSADLAAERLLVGTDGLHGDLLRSARAAYLAGQAEGLSPADAWQRLWNNQRYLEAHHPAAARRNDVVLLDAAAPTPLCAENLAAHAMFGLDARQVRPVSSPAAAS